MTDTPARPALDEGDEPTPEAILIAAWKLRFNKAFRPEEEAGALMAFLDTVGLCVVSKRSLADMRGALEATQASELAHSNCEECNGEGEAEKCEKCFPAADDALLKRLAVLARSAP